MECLLQCGVECKAGDNINNITEEKWQGIRKKAENWQGVGRFANVFSTINWENGSKGYFMHKSCFISLSSAEKLNKAKRGKEKLEKPVSNEYADENQSGENLPPSPKRLRSSLQSVIHDKNLCVWCMKGFDERHPNRLGTLYRINTLSAWRTFKRHTVFLENEVMRNRIGRLADSTTDPFAADILYHHPCWLKYITNAIRSNEITQQQKVNLADARMLFFKHVDEVIFKEREIRSLQSLLSDYKRIVNDYGYPIGDLKSSYLKEILVQEYGDSIAFKERVHKTQSEWVYDVKGGSSYIDAAINSTGITDEQLLRNLCGRIHTKITATNCVMWPPDIAQLEEEEEVCEMVVKLLTLLKTPAKDSLDLRPQTLCIASLIQQYVTGKRTILSINLGVDLHGHTRSKELVNIFHQSGICISYDDVLLLYDKWALEDLEASINCPREIANGVGAICIVDNDDFKIDTLTGQAKKAHRTNVMFVQRQSIERKSKESPDSTTPNNKKEISELLSGKAAELTKVLPYRTPISSSSEPPIRSVITPSINGSLPQRTRSVIHALVRVDGEGGRPEVDQQEVPSYSGMQACLQPNVERSKAYFQSTYPEPPSKSVIHDIMSKLVADMKLKHIPFVFFVGDMPTYKHVVTLKAENPSVFQDIVPMLGPFHQQCCFIYAIYKRFRGSGISDILVSAGVIVEGSVEQALRGKHYRRGVRCIMLMREVLILSRIKERLAVTTLSNETKHNIDTLRSALKESQENLAETHRKLEMDKDLQEIVTCVYEKPGTDMGDYWITFLEMSDTLVQNIHSCHSGNAEEYLSSTYDMLKSLMAYNNHDYGRWLPDYWASISSLPDHQYTYFQKNFTQSMTGLPYSLQAMDLWIESTMNLGSKLKQGWLNLLDNEKQLFCTTRNVNNVARIRATIRRNLKRKDRRKKHVECQAARMKKDERAVQNIQACFKEFESEPFDVSSPPLRTLQSSINASPELITDLKIALEQGEQQLHSLFEERIYSKQRSIRDTISRNARLSFVNDSLPKGENRKEKANEMEKDGLAAIFTLGEKDNLIDLGEILQHRLTVECLSVYNVDGSMRKTQKSKLLEKFVLAPLDAPREYISLIDMGYMWRLATPSPEDKESLHRDGVEYTWGAYVSKLAFLLFARHPNASKILCVNDNYNQQFSIKDDEHDRRVGKEQNIPNVFMKPGDKFPSAPKFKQILLNPRNKVRLQNLIEKQLTRCAENTEIEVIQYTGEQCKNLSTGEVEKGFSHSEADTMLLTIYNQIRDKGYIGTVIIDSEDTDVYVQTAYVSTMLEGELLIKRKKILIDCQALVTKEIADVIIAFHVMTGCDHNSGFYGHGKKSVIEKVIKSSEARNLLSSCGITLPVQQKTVSDLKLFILKYVYGSNKKTCKDVRAEKWREMKKKSTQRLVPDDDTLEHICERANYLSYCQLNFQLCEHPSPLGNGWEMINGKCRPVRHRLPPIPQNLIVERDHNNKDLDESSSEEESSASDLSSSSDSEI